VRGVAGGVARFVLRALTYRNRAVFGGASFNALELIAGLNLKVPVMVRQSLGNPASRYVRYLPEGIRKLL
jgi:hypothetical protein